MNLIVNNSIITEPIENIIYRLKKDANWAVFKEIQNKGTWLRVTCPFHKDGQEAHPSCSIFIDYNSSSVIPGTYHCFTCDAKGQLYQLVAFVLGISDEEGKDWLVSNFGNLYYEDNLDFPKWDLTNKEKEVKYLDESILEQFKWYHPYLAKRNISLETAKKFSIGFNLAKNTITFPVWDEKNNLVMITERSIFNKSFFIPEGIEKPVYLLNFVLKEKPNFVIVTEGQFNALSCWEYGYPAVALLGSGTTDYQLNILKKSGINNFVLMYDNDNAGIKGANRFIKNIGKDKFVINITMPVGKDVNDLTKEEFISLLNKYSLINK